MKKDKNGAMPHFHGTVMNRFCCHWRSEEDSFALLGTSVAISKKEKKNEHREVTEYAF